MMSDCEARDLVTDTVPRLGNEFVILLILSFTRKVKSMSRVSSRAPFCKLQYRLISFVTLFIVMNSDSSSFNVMAVSSLDIRFCSWWVETSHTSLS